MLTWMAYGSLSMVEVKWNTRLLGIAASAEKSFPSSACAPRDAKMANAKEQQERPTLRSDIAFPPTDTNPANVISESLKGRVETLQRQATSTQPAPIPDRPCTYAGIAVPAWPPVSNAHRTAGANPA